MTSIFISYRRSATGASADRLAGDLRSHFGDRQVFLDIHSLKLGHRFDEQIEETLAACDVVLVLVGKGSFSPARRPKASQTDFFVVEIQRALERKVPVIPVLVGGGGNAGALRSAGGPIDLRREPSLRDHDGALAPRRQGSHWVYRDVDRRDMEKGNLNRGRLRFRRCRRLPDQRLHRPSRCHSDRGARGRPTAAPRWRGGRCWVCRLQDDETTSAQALTPEVPYAQMRPVCQASSLRAVS